MKYFFSFFEYIYNNIKKCFDLKKQDCNKKQDFKNKDDIVKNEVVLTIKEPKVLIIAGSPSVLKYERNLDCYDIIIKLNCIPEDSKYDKYISNRCDIWAFSAHLILNKNSELHSILLNSRLKTPIKWIYTSKRWKTIEINKFWIKTNKINNFEIISNKQCGFFKKIYKFKYDLSTGMATIIHAMNIYKDITLLGFTYQQETYPHFYDDKKTFEFHDFEREKNIIENWIKEGKIKRIF